MKCPFRSYFNWLVLFIFLVNLSFIFICCLKPSEMFKTNQESNFWGYLESALLYPPWIFGTKSMLTDSIFFFLICLTPILIIIYSQVHIQKFDNQKHVNFWCSLVIRICQQLLTPYMAIPIMFRFSYMIEQVFIIRKDNDIKMILSFVICFINICLEVVHTYFAAVFLVPIDFVSHSKADYYDGKYMTSLFVIRIILTVTCFEFRYINSNLVAGIVISLIFFICFLTLYFRLTIQVHVSRIGQYLEVLPFFTCPFMLLFNYFVHNEFYSLIFILFLFVVFAIIFRIFSDFLIKQSLEAFYPFMCQNKQSYQVDSDGNFASYNLNREDFLPKFFIGSVISVIRIIETEYSDPDCLLRFLKFQKKSSEVKNAYTIEVVRFLALFPSRRKECLKELRSFKSKSNFNSFAQFIFKKILKSLHDVESTEKNLVCLNNFYRSFLVHKHLYWVARKNKKYFSASKEALSAAYFYIEVKNEFHYLMKRYTYDSFLHYYYADFCLSACGDFEAYQSECQIARMLDNTFYKNNGVPYNDELETMNIVDPLLHPMSILNPKILQYCSAEETLKNLPNKTKNYISIHRQSSFTNSKKKKTRRKKSSPVATFLNQKKYLIPMFSIFHIQIPISLFLYMISELFIKDRQIHSLNYDIYNTSAQLIDVFYMASTAIYLPYLSYEFTRNYDNTKNLFSYYEKNLQNYKIKLKEKLILNENDIENFYQIDEKVMNIMIDLPFNIINFYSQIQPLNNMTSGALFILERYISNRMLSNYTIQDVIDKIPYDLDYPVQEIINDVYLKVNDIKNYVISLREIYKNDLEGFYICKVALITICGFTVLSFFTYFIQINCIYEKDKIKIDFLSSEKLFSLFLLQESKKAWELLREFIEASSDITTADGTINSARSSVSLSNIQISASSLNSISMLENKPNQSDTNSIQEPLLEMAVKGHNFNKDLRSLINANNYIVTNYNYNYNYNNNNKKKKCNKEQENQYEEENEEEENINDNNCAQTIMISKATEKEAFLSYPFFHLLILLCAPLIFTVIVIAIFQVPLSSIATTQEELFKNILISESMANHSLILLNSTFYILEKKVGLSTQRHHYYSEKPNNYIDGWKKQFHKILNEERNIINKQVKSSKNASEIKKSFNILFKSFLNSKSIRDRTTNQTETILGLDEILSDLNNLPKFKDEICYEFIDIVCMSVENSLKGIIDSNASPQIIVSQNIPIIYLFSWNLFQDLFFSNVNDLFFMNISSGVSFFVATVLLMLTVVHVSFSSLILLRKAFNSLYHFPDDFLLPASNNSKDNLTGENEKLPQNALVVTSITASDEIYSVSDNSKEIIGRNLNDLISLKMSSTFPVVENSKSDSDSSQICEFSINEKKKKTFRFKTEQIGCLTKTVLFEENSPVVESAGEKSFVQRLNGFMPPHFAELYGKDDQTEFNFQNNFIISVRISNEIPTQMIEKCFNAANHISQYSLSIDLINVDGNMITFSSVSNCKLVVILLLIRDLIDDVFKNTKIENCIYSIYICFMENFWISVLNDGEPYLEFQPFNLEFFRFRLFQIEKGKIAFSKNFKTFNGSVLNIAEENSISVDFDGCKEKIYQLQINELHSKIVNFV